MRRLSLVVLLFVAASSAAAEQREARDGDPAAAARPLSPPLDAPTGRTAELGSGTVGQRQTREEVAPNVAPLGRIQSRIANRVQSRLRSRLDRDYDPQAGATSSFDGAGDRVRTAGRRTRR